MPTVAPISTPFFSTTTIFIILCALIIIGIYGLLSLLYQHTQSTVSMAPSPKTDTAHSEQLQATISQLLEKAKNEPDPDKKKELLDSARRLETRNKHQTFLETLESAPVTPPLTPPQVPSPKRPRRKPKPPAAASPLWVQPKDEGPLPEPTVVSLSDTKGLDFLLGKHRADIQALENKIQTLDPYNTDTADEYIKAIQKRDTLTIKATKIQATITKMKDKKPKNGAFTPQ